MKKFVCLLTIFLLLASPLYADHAHDVMVEADQIKIQVKGVVCSFCAFGAQKNLSKLDFLDPTAPNKGVHVDIKNQQITLELTKEKYINLKEVYQSIKKGGYEPEIVYLRVKGRIEKKDDTYSIHDQRSGLQFEFYGDNNYSGEIEADLHFDAKLIPSIIPDQSIEASLDRVIK